VGGSLVSGWRSLAEQRQKKLSTHLVFAALPRSELASEPQGIRGRGALAASGAAPRARDEVPKRHGCRPWRLQVPITRPSSSPVKAVTEAA